MEAAPSPSWPRWFWELNKKSLAMENKTRWGLGHFTKPPLAPAELETVSSYTEPTLHRDMPSLSQLPSLTWFQEPWQPDLDPLGTVYELYYEQSQQPKGKVLNLLTSKVWPDHSIVKSKLTHSELPTSVSDSDCLSGEAKQPRISKHLRKASYM